MTRTPALAPAAVVIFDLDGVLLDTEPLYTAATAEVAARFGKVYDWSVKRDCIGRGTLDASRIIIERLALPITPEALTEERDRRLIELFATAQPIPDAEPFTRELARRGVPMAIATSTDAALYAVKAAPHASWLSIFDAVVCGDDPRVRHAKPAPDIFLAAADALHVPPSTCLVIEDSPFGVEAALAAGMQVIAMPDPAMDRHLFARAHAVIDSFAALTPELLGL